MYPTPLSGIQACWQCCSALLINDVMDLGFMIGLKGNWKKLEELDRKKWEGIREEQNKEGDQEEPREREGN